MNLKNKRIVVTGGSGFLGRVIVEMLKEKGAEVFVPRSKEINLIEFNDAKKYIMTFKPDVVIHSAAFYGGIWINTQFPGEIYFKNLVMGANVIEASRLAKVKKFIGIGTACSYPGYLEGALVEKALWDGPLHESVRCYGLTKKMMQVQCEAYKKQYKFNGIHLILTNLYGEWDSYNPERSHVVAALIRKFVEAKIKKQKSVTVWGTGKPIREFLYVRDAAEGIVKAAECYDKIEPINIGTGRGTSIKELVTLIKKASGFKGQLIWDKSKPDGQFKKVLFLKNMYTALENWEPPTPLEEGLQHTIEWFGKNYEKAIKRW